MGTWVIGSFWALVFIRTAESICDRLLPDLPLDFLASLRFQGIEAASLRIRALLEKLGEDQLLGLLIMGTGSVAVNPNPAFGVDSLLLQQLTPGSGVAAVREDLEFQSLAVMVLDCIKDIL